MGRNLLFQSTPPRRRRPQQTNPDDIHGGISIHASAKEATRSCEGCRKRCGFQSTPPRRRRRQDSCGCIKGDAISIHASAKEATLGSSAFARRYLFQSTPPRRRRPQHIVILQLSCTYLVSTTFLSTIFSFISQYVVLFFLF